MPPHVSVSDEEAAQDYLEKAPAALGTRLEESLLHDTEHGRQGEVVSPPLHTTPSQAQIAIKLGSLHTSKSASANGRMRRARADAERKSARAATSGMACSSVRSSDAWGKQTSVRVGMVARACATALPQRHTLRQLGSTRSGLAQSSAQQIHEYPSHQNTQRGGPSAPSLGMLELTWESAG